LARILTIVGARPQFVKAAVVSLALVESGVEEVLLHTGQHYDERMSDVFFREMGIPAPAHMLQVGSASHGAQTGRMLEGIEAALQQEKPDAVLVYGDTNSTLAGALAAAKLHIPVAHVESGLRSFNRKMPEEINRVLTDHISRWLFCPTDSAVSNLAAEGITGEHVFQVGDVMFDAAQRFGAHPSVAEAEILTRLGLTSGAYVLSTVHRAENTDDPARLAVIIEALGRVAQEMPVVLPLHPRTVALAGAALTASGVKVIEPVGYLDMLALERGAAVVATDSGGVQKEAFFQRAPCVTFRDETEWVELVEAGWNTVIPPVEADALAAEILAARTRPGQDVALYGGGDASRRIADVLSRLA
jgi:UDP-GlcNAc3NAcA epimerase